MTGLNWMVIGNWHIFFYRILYESTISQKLCSLLDYDTDSILIIDLESFYYQSQRFLLSWQGSQDKIDEPWYDVTYVKAKCNHSVTLATITDQRFPDGIPGRQTVQLDKRTWR